MVGAISMIVNENSGVDEALSFLKASVKHRTPP